MYKILYLPTAEQIIKPTNKHGNIMTIKQVRRYLKSNESYIVRYTKSNIIYFTNEPEYIDNHPDYNISFCYYMNRIKIDKHFVSVIREK